MYTICLLLRDFKGCRIYIYIFLFNNAFKEYSAHFFFTLKRNNCKWKYSIKKKQKTMLTKPEQRDKWWAVRVVWISVFVFYCISFGLTCRWGEGGRTTPSIMTPNKTGNNIAFIRILSKHYLSTFLLFLWVIVVFIFFQHFVMPQWIKIQSLWK